MQVNPIENSPARIKDSQIQISNYPVIYVGCYSNGDGASLSAGMPMLDETTTELVTKSQKINTYTSHGRVKSTGRSREDLSNLSISNSNCSNLPQKLVNGKSHNAIHSWDPDVSCGYSWNNVSLSDNHNEIDLRGYTTTKYKTVIL